MTKIRLLLTSIRISKEIYPLNDPSSRWFLWSRKISASWRTNLKLRLWISKQFENFITGWKWNESYVKQFWLVVVNCFGKMVMIQTYETYRKNFEFEIHFPKKEIFPEFINDFLEHAQYFSRIIWTSTSLCIPCLKNRLSSHNYTCSICLLT